ncbi:MAG: YdeI/OmpD-associated family protein [Anaerolineales bacterium]
METLELNTIAEWRTWLSQNHNCFSEIWLVYYKKESGLPSLEYKETLDEALCYGWVDSIIKKLDDEKYVRKFTPRREDSKWSLVNKTRVEELIVEGRMTEHGLALVEAAKKSGAWDNPGTKPEMDFEIPEELSAALEENPEAAAFFESLAKTYRKQYIAWIATAKRAETREKRTAEAIQLLAEGKKLGLK